MAKQTASFVDQHIEKVVVGVCAAALIGVAAYYFSGSPYVLEDQSPGRICDQALADAQETLRRVNNAVKPSGPKDGAPGQEKQIIESLEQWIGRTAKGLVELAGLSKEWPRVQPFPPVLVKVGEVDEADRLDLAQFVSPGQPIVMGGRTTFSMPAKLSIADLIRNGGPSKKTAPSTHHWVSVGAQLDLFDQATQFRSAGYPRGAATTMLIGKVHLQRKDVTESGADWEDVEPYAPFLPIEKPRLVLDADGKIVNRSKTTPGIYRGWLDRCRDLIARTELPFKAEGSRGDDPNSLPLPYLGDPIGGAAETPEGGTPGATPMERAARWRSLAERHLRAKEPNLDAAYILACAAMKASGLLPKDAKLGEKIRDDVIKAMNAAKVPVPAAAPREPEYLMPIVAHDLSPEPGRTYVYRMRYEVFNAWAGDPGRLKNPKDALKVTVFSDWSPVSRPIEVKSDLYVYLVRSHPRDQQVRVALFKQQGGSWVRTEVKVRAGEPVTGKTTGRRPVTLSTNLLCLDIDFEYESSPGKKDVRAVFVDMQDGSLTERFLSRDQRDPRMQKLLASAGG